MFSTKKNFKFSLKKFCFNLNKKDNIIFGNFGIKSLNKGLITAKNIENFRRKLSKQFKKLNNLSRSKIFFKFVLWKGYTKKPMLSRMGKGAGPINNWKTLIKPGNILMEISSYLPIVTVLNIFKNSIKNFPLKLLLIKKRF